MEEGCVRKRDDVLRGVGGGLNVEGMMVVKVGLEGVHRKLYPIQFH